MSVVDAIYQRMKDDTEAVPSQKGESELAKFYAGLTILVTGATDLIGKCLIEKLLRDCPEIARIYVLMRVKKGEVFQDKCDKLYRDSVFDRLSKVQPEFPSKLVPIKGDLTKERLALSDADYKTLAETTNIIFHNGSATKLDEQVTIALQTNVLGTKRMLDLARDCKQLRAFLQVSTAYSHCNQRLVEEKFYRSPADLKTIQDMLEADQAPSGLSNDSLKMLLGDWPNIYTYSKAVAEDFVQQCAPRSSFACCVFRPSAVISTYKEPLPGWCDSKNGPASLFCKIGMGAVHVVHNIDYPLDLVPADLSVNAMIVCAWDAIDRWQTEPEAFVYNYGTSQEKPITIMRIRDKISEDPNAFYTSKSKRRAYVVFASNIVTYFILRVLLDYIPALIADIFLVLHGQPPQSWSLVRESMLDMCRLWRFSLGNWRVRITETLKACERLNPRDRELFGCEPGESLDWDDYFLTYWRGVRRFALKDSSEESKGRCPCSCKCPCKCKVGCLGLLAAIGAIVYYALSALFY